MGTERHGTQQGRRQYLFIFRTEEETGSGWYLEECGVPGNQLGKTFLSFWGGCLGEWAHSLPRQQNALPCAGLGRQHLYLSLCYLQWKCEPVKSEGRVSP